MTAKVRAEVERLIIQSPDGSRVWELRANEEVPPEALEFYSHPRSIEFGDES